MKLYAFLIMISSFILIISSVSCNDIKEKEEVLKKTEVEKQLESSQVKDSEYEDLKEILNRDNNINDNNHESNDKNSNLFSFKSTSDDSVSKNEQPILRKTLDGRNCAKTFVQDGKTYNDCTKANLPTGVPTEKEWCYVDEEYANTGSKWAYCQPIMDYNRVRVYNYDQLRELTKSINILDHDINSNISPAQSTIESANQVKVVQLELSNNLNQLTIDTKALSLNLKKNMDVKTDIEKKETIVKELNLKIDTLSKDKSNDEKTNCDGMLLYEDYPQGDGLKVFYFDNESWLGNSIISKDENVNFDWTNTSPIKEINSKNFSIIWEGFILPPYSGDYSFTLTADSGGILFVNEKVIISHNIGTITDNSKNKLISIISPSNETGKKIETFVSKSKPIRLLGNTYVKIKLAYFHSYHSTPFKDNTAFVKLQWESDEFNLRDIESTKFFSINTLPPLKVTDFDTDNSILRKLHEGDDFFKNSSRYIIQDIPFEFLGMTSLKFKKRFQGDQISFHVNTRCIVYVGLLKHYPYFLPGDFNNSGYKFQLLQIDTISKPANKKLVAEKASTVEIFKKEYDEGLVRINLKKEGLNKHGVNLIIFFGFNSTVKKPVICQGDELIPSLSTSQDFKSCTASSEKSGYKCNGAFSNRMIDEEGAIWASDNEGIGAWIKVNFNGFYEIVNFSFKNRMNPAERNSKIQLLFSTGQLMNINLSNSDKVENIKLEPIRVNWVKITITGVYGTLNNGGAFSFFGTKCNENSNRKLFLSEPEQNFFDPLFSTEEDGVVYLSCFDSLANSMKFDNLDLSIDKKLTVNCSENCINYDVPVYGTNLYSEDSSICKSAFHSMKLSSNGGLVTMIIKAGTKHYKASNSNGVRSEGKFQSNISIMFEMYNPEDNIILKVGSKVDLKMDAADVKEELANGKPSLWQPAVIMSVIDTSNGKFVKLMLDGKNSKVMDFPYPYNEKISPCGYHIKNRKCDNSLKKVTNKSPILIRFVPSGYLTTDDFLPDFGYEFGKGGKPYGWNRNINDRLRQRFNPSKPELETLIMFPPDSKSIYCNNPAPDNLCEPVTWSAKVGKGLFIVRLYIGDAKEAFVSDLEVNRKIFTKSMVVEKNRMEIIEKIVESINGFINISASCTENCDNSINRLSAIKITPFVYDDDQDVNPLKGPKETPTSCGKAFTGGRCITGPEVLHCVFNDPTIEAASFCTEDNILKAIPTNYTCKDQIGHYKCVKKLYINEDECKLFCPTKCLAERCA